MFISAQDLTVALGAMQTSRGNFEYFVFIVFNVFKNSIYLYSKGTVRMTMKQPI